MSGLETRERNLRKLKNSKNETGKQNNIIVKKLSYVSRHSPGDAEVNASHHN
jgi:hypothetical protein